VAAVFARVLPGLWLPRAGVVRLCAILASFAGPAICTAAAISADSAGPSPRAGKPAPGTLRIAVCQILCVDGDVEGNLRRIARALEVASAQNADLACFPESAVFGWINPEAHERADPIPGPMTRRLGELAVRHRLMICIGLDEKDGERLYDSAVLIGRDGALLLKQRKIDTLAGLNLVDPPYAHGSLDEVKPAETPLGTIGVVVCSDALSQELMEKMARSSPDLLLVPVAWAARKPQWPQYGRTLATMIQKTAASAGCPVIGTNCVGVVTHGPWAGRIYGGQSVVADAEGTLLGVLRDRDAEVRVLELKIGRRPPALPDSAAPAAAPPRPAPAR
jgi:predicted amidohydrolase